MIQETAGRFHNERGFASPLVVCNEAHRFTVADQMMAIDCEPAAIILEPCARNTAPAIAAAALVLAKTDPDAVMLVLPADHVIKDQQDFIAKTRLACTAAQSGHLVTFGIVPDSAHTGYGYIKAGDALSDGLYAVADFVEKPDQKTAEAYLANGDYSWNSGMFAFPAQGYLDELAAHEPEILAAVKEAVGKASSDLDFTRLDEESFAQSPSISVDYAVMEKTDKAAVIPSDFGWNDIGAWDALWQVGDKDEHDNVTLGDVYLEDTSGSYVRAEGKLAAVVGVRDLVIVETPDALLVADRTLSGNVKAIAELLKADNRSEADFHQRVHRPWGWYESLVEEDGVFQAKRLSVKPGARLSLQLHHKRAEHWVVIKGTARVTVGDKVFDLTADQSTYIPVETKHRLENPTDGLLEIIEVQSGSYLGEDDIERFEDDYARDK